MNCVAIITKAMCRSHLELAQYHRHTQPGHHQGREIFRFIAELQTGIPLIVGIATGFHTGSPS
jgi:hypothetical protein